MSPRTGRPKSENPKDVRFSIRLDSDMFSKLETKSKKDGITVAEAIRAAISEYLGKKK